MMGALWFEIRDSFARLPVAAAPLSAYGQDAQNQLLELLVLLRTAIIYRVLHADRAANQQPPLDAAGVRLHFLTAIRAGDQEWRVEDQDHRSRRTATLGSLFMSVLYALLTCVRSRSQPVDPYRVASQPWPQGQRQQRAPMSTVMPWQGALRGALRGFHEFLNWPLWNEGSVTEEAELSEDSRLSNAAIQQQLNWVQDQVLVHTRRARMSAYSSIRGHLVRLADRTRPVDYQRLDSALALLRRAYFVSHTDEMADVLEDFRVAARCHMANTAAPNLAGMIFRLLLLRQDSRSARPMTFTDDVATVAISILQGGMFGNYQHNNPNTRGLAFERLTVGARNRARVLDGLTNRQRTAVIEDALEDYIQLLAHRLTHFVVLHE